MEHMPPVAVQAFPVDDEADEARDKNTGLGRRERARLDLRGPSPGGRSSLPKQATRLPPFAAQPAQRLPKQTTKTYAKRDGLRRPDEQMPRSALLYDQRILSIVSKDLMNS